MPITSSSKHLTFHLSHSYISTHSLLSQWPLFPSVCSRSFQATSLGVLKTTRELLASFSGYTSRPGPRHTIDITVYGGIFNGNRNETASWRCYKSYERNSSELDLGQFKDYLQPVICQNRKTHGRIAGVSPVFQFGRNIQQNIFNKNLWQISKIFI